MIIISAISENYIIGSGEGMPWNVPAEYAQYLDFVRGNTVIMGRRTYEIFGADLPDSTTAIVISRSAQFDTATMVSSLEDALDHAQTNRNEIFVAGGASVYAQAIPRADAMYLSTIKGDFEGDTQFPPFDPADWEVIEQRDEPEFIFRKYQRIRPAE